MKNIMATVLACMGMIALSSCTKEPLKNMTEEESRIYVTNHDNTVSFSDYKTFSIADSASIIDNNRLVQRERTAWDADLIAAIATQMQSRGFTIVDRLDNPDLGINISRIYNTYTGVVEYPGYLGGYGSYYDPFYWGYGGYNYWFPPSYGFYEVTEGAVSVDMLDLKNAASSNQIKGVWNGLIRGSGTFRQTNAGTHAARLFEQSPYLITNN